MAEGRFAPKGQEVVLLVGMGLLGHDYIPAAHRSGLQVALVERQELLEQVKDEVEMAYRCAGVADQYWLSAAMAAAGSCSPRAVIPYAEPQVVAAAWVNERYGLDGASLGAAVASRDKGLQRALLQAASVLQPEFVLAQTIEEACAFAAGRGPVVVKALHSSGSRGVSLAATEDELGRRFSALPPGEVLVVESYVDGPEYSVEALVRNGQVVFRNYTEKLTTGPPEFVELGHIVPAELGRAEEAAADKVLDGVVAALGVGSSLMHAEFRVSGSQAYVLEVALRTPGDHIMSLINLAYGIDLFRGVVEIAAGLPEQLVPAPKQLSTIRYLEVAPGVIAGTHGEAAARTLPGVERLELPYRVGQSVPALRMSRDRGGFVIVRAATRSELEDRVAAVLGTVRVITG